MTRLTITTDPEVASLARKLAAAQGTSVSEFMARLLRSLVGQVPDNDKLPPLTRQAMGIVRLPPDKNDRELLEDALQDKYGPF